MKLNLAVVLAAAFCFSGVAKADTVAVFDNGSVVDTSGGSSAESDNVQASLAFLGHTVTTFTGTSAAAWTAAGAGADAIAVPEFEEGNLFLSGSARAAIRSYVAAGGTLIKFSGFSRDTAFLNTVFGFSLDHDSSGGPSSLNAAAAAGTPFAGGPATLPNHSDTDSVDTDSLPAGGLSIYRTSSDTMVALIPYFSGNVVLIGWDWFDAAPVGDENGGWLAVLNSAVATGGGGAGGPVPEPSTLVLLGAAAAGFVLVRRRRS